MREQIDLPFFKALLIDDHILFAQSLAELIRAMAPASDINYMTSVEKIREELKANEYQFLLIDLLIPGVDTKEFISYCVKKYPTLIIIVISSVIDISKIKECFSIGIGAYLTKAISSYELKLALEKTYRGEKYISSDLSGRLASSFFSVEQNNLTTKELEVLRLVAAGNTVNQIAATLHSSPFTIMAHRRKIMKKLDLHSAAELVKYAFENNLT